MAITRPTRYRVADIRAAGLEARWGRTRRGAPIILARDPQARHRHQRETWWCVDRTMWDEAQKVGLREAFDRCTLLGEFFSF